MNNMKKNLIWIGIIILIITFFVILVLIERKKEERPFKKYDYPETIIINNYRLDKRVDTIALTLSYKVFEIDTIEIIIDIMPKHFNNNNFKYYGIITPYSFRDRFFLLLLDEKMSIEKMKTVLSHEFIHIEQYISGDLKMVYKNDRPSNIMVYKNDTINLEEVKYENRPFEKDAFSNQYKIKKELNKYLY